jgi:hypothetical protein
MDNQRPPSPTSTAPYSRAQSILSIHSVRTITSTQSRPPLHGVQAEGTSSTGIQIKFSDARTHHFLRRADPHDLSRPRAQDCTIRHSDIVSFSFRNLDIPEDLENLSTVMGTLRCAPGELEMMMHALNFVRQDQFSLTMKRHQIQQIEEFWTGTVSQQRISSSNTGQMVKAFYFFRTFFQPKDWQLKRELYCVTFSEKAAALIARIIENHVDYCFEDNVQTTNPDDVIHELQNLRYLSGRQSVGNAIIEAVLYLSHCDNDGAGGIRVNWHLPDQRMPKEMAEKFAALFVSVSRTEDSVCSYHRQSESLFLIHRTVEAAEATGVTSGLQDIPDDVCQNEALIMVRASHWPRECPKFCLFVLIDQNFDDTMQLGLFIHRAISTPEMYFPGGFAEGQSLSRREKETLRSWENSWKNG